MITGIKTYMIGLPFGSTYRKNDSKNNTPKTDMAPSLNLLFITTITAYITI